MKYTSFYIKNYKGIKELTLDLERRPETNIITLVGLNESGKTSILEAISLLENEIEGERRHELIPKAEKSDFDNSIEIHATVKLNEEEQKELSENCWTFDFRELTPIEGFTIKLVYNYEDSVFISDNSGHDYEFTLHGIKKNHSYKKYFDRHTEEFWKVAEHLKDNYLPSIIYYPNFLFEFPNRIYLDKKDWESKAQVLYRRVFGDIIDTVRKGLDIERHITSRIRQSDNEGIAEALDSTLDQMSSRITRVVFDAWKELFDASGKEIKLKYGLDREKDSCYLEVRLKEGTNSYHIAERSMGFRWFFTFLLFTEFRKNREGEKGEILFLLDEPASNLHSTAQKNLLKTFEGLVSDCKLIYTTHSHHLINPKWLSGAYIVKNKALDYNEEFSFEIGKTEIEAIVYKQFVVDHPEQRTYFQPILDALEHQPGLLEEVPNIILTEGKNDYYTFKYINEVLFNNRYDSLNFYPGNGAERNNQIIAMYLAWNRDFTILLDGDKAGIDAKKRYKKEFGEIIEPHILTLKDIDEKFSCATENLFSETERVQMTQRFEAGATEFHKSKFNTAIQQLLVSEEHIELDSSTEAKFDKILDFLNK